MSLPEWLDLTKIGSTAVILMAIINYFKSGIPEKLIQYITVIIGILISILAELYVGAALNWVRAILNGVLAAVLADTGYKFLKGSPFEIGSKKNEK